MAHNGKNDKQQPGFRTTYIAAKQKAYAKAMKEKVTLQELADFEQSYRNIIGSLMALNNWIIDNAGLREKYNAAIAEEKAKAEATAPNAEAATTPEATV